MIGRVAVVADCAHSLGASRVVGGVKKYCGAIADFSSFSFIGNQMPRSKFYAQKARIGKKTAQNPSEFALFDNQIAA